MPADFYDLLEVSEDASDAEIKAAYRRKAREYHPDVNDDERAPAQFKVVRTAYEVLADDVERAAYDRLGHETYVDERLEGLPTGVIGGMAGNRSVTTSRRSGAGATPKSTTGRSGAERGGSTPGSSVGETASRATTASAGEGVTGSSTAAGTTAAGAGVAPGSDGAAAASAGNAWTEAAARRTRAERRRRARRHTARPGGGSDGRRLLPLAWGVVLLAGVAYAAGLGAYLSSIRGPISDLLGSLSTDPVAALSASAPALGPFVDATLAGATPLPSILLPIGAVALPAALAVTVSRFGRGTAWLYVLCALAPAAVIGASLAAPSAVRPVAVDALLLVVVPVAATLVFLWDVGRYLRASS